ncbi:MATE family efflux transporter [Coprobacter tertius]|nr:MATE family efflux transporter [Coprobacter tertius]
MFTRKEIWTVSYPILISLVVQNLINITDTAFLGRVGEVELGASALAGVYYMAVYMIGFGFSTGSQILMARRNGEKRFKDIGSIMLQSTFFLILLAALLWGLNDFCSPWFLRLMINSKEIYNATTEYLDYRIYGLFFSFISAMFRAFYVGITKTRILTVNAIIMAVSNIILNYIFIFGKFGCPAMGIGGAALGSVLSELISVIYYILYTNVKVDTKKYAFFDFTHFDPKVIVRVLNVSIWTMIQFFIPIITWFVFFVAIEHLGERQLAIANIVRSVSTIFFMPVNAFAATACTLVSNAMGAGHPDEVPRISLRIMKMCYMVILPLMLLVFLWPSLLLRIYTDNQELIQGSILSMYVMVLYYFLAVPGSIWFHTVAGTGNTRTTMVIETFTAFVYMVAIYVIILLFRPANVALCWFVEYIYWAVLLLLSWLYIKKARWQNKKI